MAKKGTSSIKGLKDAAMKATRNGSAKKDSIKKGLKKDIAKAATGADSDTPASNSNGGDSEGPGASDACFV